MLRISLHARKIENEMILTDLTTSILLVLNNFINRRFAKKSRYERSDLSTGQVSKPYSKIGIHLLFINCQVISSRKMEKITFRVLTAIMFFCNFCLSSDRSCTV